MVGLAYADALKGAMDKAGLLLRTDVDVVGAMWTERPTLPMAAIYEHTAPHATTSRVEKLNLLRQAMALHQATHHWVSTVDDIAWITNLRGNDVDYNPVFLAHLLVSGTHATLYVGQGKLNDALVDTLRRDGIEVADYAAARAAVSGPAPVHGAADRPQARDAGASARRTCVGAGG